MNRRGIYSTEQKTQIAGRINRRGKVHKNQVAVRMNKLIEGEEQNIIEEVRRRRLRQQEE